MWYWTVHHHSKSLAHRQFTRKANSLSPVPSNQKYPGLLTKEHTSYPSVYWPSFVHQTLLTPHPSERLAWTEPTESDWSSRLVFIMHFFHVVSHLSAPFLLRTWPLSIWRKPKRSPAIWDKEMGLRCYCSGLQQVRFLAEHMAIKCLEKRYQTG